MMSDIDFGKLFNRLCEQSGKNNAEIARGLNVDKATIGRWRSGERSPKLSSLSEIADYFNVDIKIFSKKKNSNIEDNLIFSSVDDAMLFIIQNPTVAAYGGYDLDKMSDQDKIDFANQIAETIKFFGQKFIK